MALNQFVVFDSSMSNSYSYSVYVTLGTVVSGVVAGTADPLLANTTWRQATTMAAVVGGFIVQQLNQDAIDSGNTLALLPQFTAAVQSLGRIMLGSNLALYVNPSTGSDTNNGQAATPWQSLQHAWAVIQQSFDFAGYTITLHMADGIYTSGLIASGPLHGALGAGSLVIVGNTGTPTNVTFNFLGNGVVAQSGAGMTVSGINFAGLTGTGQNGNGLIAGTGGIINIGTGVVFGTCMAAHMLAQQGGQIVAAQPYTIAGGAGNHMIANGGGSEIIIQQPVTLTGTPAFAIQFAKADILGEISLIGATYSGAATGVRYIANGNAVINSGGNTLPGSAAGSVMSGGLFL